MERTFTILVTSHIVITTCNPDKELDRHFSWLNEDMVLKKISRIVWVVLNPYYSSTSLTMFPIGCVSPLRRFHSNNI